MQHDRLPTHRRLSAQAFLDALRVWLDAAPPDALSPELRMARAYLLEPGARLPDANLPGTWVTLVGGDQRTGAAGARAIVDLWLAAQAAAFEP